MRLGPLHPDGADLEFRDLDCGIVGRIGEDVGITLHEVEGHKHHPFPDPLSHHGLGRDVTADAGQMGISQGDSVKVTSRRGDITAKTMVTERVREGMVFMPFHFVESNANILTNPAHDPTVRIPEFKVCAVKVERA